MIVKKFIKNSVAMSVMAGVLLTGSAVATVSYNNKTQAMPDMSRLSLQLKTTPILFAGSFGQMKASTTTALPGADVKSQMAQIV